MNNEGIEVSIIKLLIWGHYIGEKVCKNGYQHTSCNGQNSRKAREVLEGAETEVAYRSYAIGKDKNDEKERSYDEETSKVNKSINK